MRMDSFKQIPLCSYIFLNFFAQLHTIAESQICTISPQAECQIFTFMLRNSALDLFPLQLQSSSPKVLQNGLPSFGVICSLDN